MRWIQCVGELLKLEWRRSEQLDQFVINEPANCTLLAEHLLWDAEVGWVVQSLRLSIPHQDVDPVHEPPERTRRNDQFVSDLLSERRQFDVDDVLAPRVLRLDQLVDSSRHLREVLVQCSGWHVVPV